MSSSEQSNLEPTRRYVVGRNEDLPPGSSTVTPIGKFGVGVFNVKGKYYALTNYCPHQGGPLCRGLVSGMAVWDERPYGVQWVREGEILQCPWHGWQFDITTGRSLAFPNRRIRTYPVTVQDGEVIIETG